MTPVTGGGPPRVPAVFHPTDAARRVVRDLPPLVVLRAPRGFGKTSTVAYWLRSGELDDRSSVWLTLTGPTSAAGLWQAVGASLRAADLTVTGAGQAAVDVALTGLRQRVVVVIDGLHHVPAEVDAELVELTQRHELLHLVVISKLERAIESLAPATVDTALLRVRELRLDAKATMSLAERLGIDISEDEAARLVRDVAGWPALVRAVLLETRRTPSGRLTTDETALARYLAVMLDDEESEPWRDTLLAIAVPEKLAEEDLDVLFPEPAKRAFARTFIERSISIRREGDHWVMAGRLRPALVDWLRTEQPDRYRALHDRLARHRRGNGEPTVALTHAVQAEAWPLVLGILEENWAELLRHHAGRLGTIVRTMPAELVARSPRLVVARDHILHTDVLAAAEAALRAGWLAPGSEFPERPMTTTQRLLLRFDGTPTFGAAEILLGHLDSTAAEHAPDRVSPEVRSAVPELLTQWGLSMIYEHDAVSAIYAFALACRAATQGEDPMAAREAASGAAMAAAILGHLTLAEQWTDHARTFRAEPTALERVAAPATAALVAGMALRPVPAVPRRRAGTEVGLLPLEQLSGIMRAFTDLLLGRQDRARVEVNRFPVVHDDGLEVSVRALLDTLRVDVALADGRIDAAGALLAHAAHRGAFPLAARARHAFYVGAYREAMRLTERALTHTGARPRIGLELMLIHACAAWRCRATDAALDHLATAVGIAEDTGVLLPFLTVPRADLEAMSPPGTEARELLDRAPLAGTDTPFPEPIRSEELSQAELRVLRALADGQPITTLGRRLYIAESTVKTHLRRIYRKLGVASRGEAVERGRELFLLD